MKALLLALLLVADPLPGTPAFAPKNSVGSLIYQLCGEDIAIAWVLESPEGPMVLTELIRGAPDPTRARSILKALHQIEQEGGPVHTVLLDRTCQAT